MALSPTAVIKVGSTSTTWLIADTLREPRVRRQRLLDLYGEGAEARLQEAMEEALADCRQQGATPLGAGGEAVRNHPSLNAALRRWLPQWWDLSGLDEGRLAWLAVKAERPDTDVVIDLGGGSTEIVSRTTVDSLPTGASRCVMGLRWPDVSGSGRRVFIGGTAVALAYWRRRSEGLTVSDVRAMLEALSGPSRAIAGLDPLRLRILPNGLRIMEEILTQQRTETFSVSGRGLTEGLWLAASLGRRAP